MRACNRHCRSVRLGSRSNLSLAQALIATTSLIFIGALLASTTAAICLPEKGGHATKVDAGKKRVLMRLSKDVRPTAYDLMVEPDLKKFTFSGAEEITLSVAKPVREIVLNATDLEISQAQILPVGGTNVNGTALGAQIVPDAKSERVRIVLKHELPAGTYRLSCKFKGTLNDMLRGFYRSSFEDDKHAKHWLCATQMEPIDARRMFPCFDEPEFKATFHIQAVMDPIYTAISNSPVEKEESLNGKKQVTFEVTPKMSSYLVALIVAELKATGEKTVDGVPIKVWTAPGKEHLGQYVLGEAARIMTFEREYFGIAFPNKKLDLIGLPDFASGAMENLGAITFRDSLLLIDDKTGSISSKESITSVTAHEMAHQWFGDLVTMRWWDDIWLNEAFASWMATKTSDALHPEWRVMTNEVAGRGGMHTDALRTTRAIHADVTDPGQVKEMFDDITYGKGESVLRMLESFVGKEAFQKGVNKYLTDYSWSNATTEDLWHAIAACAKGAPVAQIMKTFVYQPGVPLVSVALKDDGRSISASQTRYFPLGDDKKDKSLWLIPLVMRKLPSSAEGNLNTSQVAQVLMKKEATLPLGSKWPAAVVNASGMGYYHTCYSPALLKQLEDNFKDLTVEEKLIATSDVSALTLCGRVPIEEAYNFALNLPNETDPLVLSDLVGYYFGPHIYMTDATKQPYEKLIQYKAGPLKAKLGWTEKPDESEAEKSLRTSVLTLMGTYGQDKQTIKEASDLFESYIKDHKSVGPNITSIVFGIVSYNGGIKEYNEIMALYKSAQNPEDRNRALYSLAGFHNKQLAQKTLAFAMSKDVRLQDGLSLLCDVAAQRETRAVGWPFVKEHWSEITHKFPEGHLRSLTHAGSNVETRAQEAEVRAWFASHPIPDAKTAIARMEERMDLQMLRRERFGERIKRWTLAQAAKLPSAPAKVSTKAIPFEGSKHVH
jgi:puromycin-sensitive aminopeptidase